MSQVDAQESFKRKLALDKAMADAQKRRKAAGPGGTPLPGWAATAEYNHSSDGSPISPGAMQSMVANKPIAVNTLPTDLRNRTTTGGSDTRDAVYRFNEPQPNPATADTVWRANDSRNNGAVAKLNTLPTDLKDRSTLGIGSPTIMAARLDGQPTMQKPIPSWPTQMTTAMGPNPSEAVVPASDARAEQMRARILQNRARDVLSNQKQRLLSSSSLADFGGDNNARIAAIHATSDQLANIEGSQRVPQREMGGSEIQAAHVGLGNQGKAMAAERIRMIQEKMKSDPANAGKLQPELDDAVRMEAAFNDPKWGAYSPTELSQRVTGQENARMRQKDMQTAYTGLAESDATKRQAMIDRNIADQALARDYGRSGLEAAVAENKLKANTANVGNDPELIKAQMQQRLAAEMAAATAAKANQATTARSASFQTAGITPEFTQQAVGNAAALREAMSDISSGSVAGGGFWGGAEKARASSESLLRQLPQIENMAQMDPAAAAQVAGEILGAMPQPGPDGSYSSTSHGGNLFNLLPTDAAPINQRNRRETAMNLNMIRRRLSAIAQGK